LQKNNLTNKKSRKMSTHTALETLALLEKSKDNNNIEFAKAVREFLAESDHYKCLLPKLNTRYQWAIPQALGNSESWDKQELALVILTLRLAFEPSRDNSLLHTLAHTIKSQVQLQQELISIADELQIQNQELAEVLKYILDSSLDWTTLPGEIPPHFQSPFSALIWGLDDVKLAHLSNSTRERHIDLLALYRPEAFQIWLKSNPCKVARTAPQAWIQIIDATSEHDHEVLNHPDIRQDPHCAITTFNHLFSLRPETTKEALTKLLKNPKFAARPEACENLVKLHTDEALEIFGRAVDGNLYIVSHYTAESYEPIFEMAVENLEPQGLAFFEKVILTADADFIVKAIRFLIPLKKENHPVINDYFKGIIHPHSTDYLQTIWSSIITNAPELFIDELFELLENKSKNLRSMAINALIDLNPSDLTDKAITLLSEKKIDSRLGSIELLSLLGDAAIKPLQKALTKEKSQKVITAIETALSKLGAPVISEDISTEDLLQQIESDKKIKLPKAPWLDLSKIPLLTGEGKPLSEKALTFLIQKQSKHKTIDAAPAIGSVLELLDHEKNTTSALILLNQWLASGQEAKDRWALTLAGLLGDNRMILALEPRIDPWCKESRHKLAEYAAQAISLLASEEALMVLDSLKNRYSRKYKNIGRACGEAFNSAAQARGVSVDELADMIVPDLGFNEENQRALETGDTPVLAVLTNDFKLTWYHPETEKETKSPPTNLSAEAKAEVADLRKFIRTAAKAQNLRLEQSLVTQRRWPVRRWQELFENQPLLKPFASRLVWGIYNSNNELLRTFRRYDNGILATGGGEMEDLEEDDTTISILHPLELSDEQKSEWLDHFGRFKIKPPFPQLVRPVELLDPAHGNRRQITFTENINMSVGTFRSRSEKRNWVRGSVVDAGGITCQYKTFPEAGVEAFVLTEDYWVGQEPMEILTLGIALFAKAGSIDHGSYVYDDPNPDDPRVLTFAEVPAIVYSEVTSDLKAIIEGQD